MVYHGKHRCGNSFFVFSCHPPSIPPTSSLSQNDRSRQQLSKDWPMIEKGCLTPQQMRLRYVFGKSTKPYSMHISPRHGNIQTVILFKLVRFEILCLTRPAWLG